MWVPPGVFFPNTKNGQGFSPLPKRAIKSSATLARGFAVLGVKLNADEASAKNLGGKQRAAGTAEGVEHDLAAIGESLNDRL